MTLWDRLVGQEDVVATLRRAAADAALGREGEPGPAMTHAWLLTGPPGAGRSTAAQVFAAALLCEQQGCGQCETCREVMSDTHADVSRFSTPGTQIRREQVEELLALAARLPSFGRYRVMIVEDADRLNDTSGNMLLKSIEEPTAHTVWVLCSPSPVDVLPTILSRCRVAALRTPPWRDVARMLEAQEGVDPAMAAFAARVSQGHIGRARALATDEAARLRRQEVLRLPLSLHDLPACFAAAADIVAAATDDATAWTGPLDAAEVEEVLAMYGDGATGKGMTSKRAERQASAQLKELELAQKRRRTRAVRDGLDRAMIDLMSFYRDVLVLQLGVDTELVNEELRPALGQVAAAGTPESTRSRLEAITRTRTSFESNAAPQLLIEALTVELARP